MRSVLGPASWSSRTKRILTRFPETRTEERRTSRWWKAELQRRTFWKKASSCSTRQNRDGFLIIDLKVKAQIKLINEVNVVFVKSSSKYPFWRLKLLRYRRQEGAIVMISFSFVEESLRALIGSTRRAQWITPRNWNLLFCGNDFTFKIWIFSTLVWTKNIEKNYLNKSL